MSAVLLGTAVHPPRLELPIATEPRASNISTAPLCATYAATPYYDDAIAPPGDAGRCTTVSGLIVDERSKGGGLCACTYVPAAPKALVTSCTPLTHGTHRLTLRCGMSARVLVASCLVACAPRNRPACVCG
jgi:hypothetical protein